MKVAEHYAESPVEALTTPVNALSASKWSGVAKESQGWDSGQSSEGVMPGLNFYSQQMIVKVDQVNEAPTTQE